jgi:O-antigen/teichoic acid export membrane protein
MMLAHDSIWLPIRAPEIQVLVAKILAGAVNGSGLRRNLACNLVGESIPALAALAAIPILVHRLGAERFGVLTLAWMLAGYFGLFDFGLGRALNQAMAREWSVGNGARAAAMFWTALAMTFALSAFAALGLALLAPWLTRSALTIPPPLRHETLTGLYLIASGLPMLISASALRAALSAADRFDLLNLVRTPVGIMSFGAPLLMLPFTHNLAWLIGVLVLNRALSWTIYLGVLCRAFPDLRAHFRIDPECAFPLLGFGAWITVSAAVAPMLVYLDRFFIGVLLPIAALAAYSIPMEIVSKSFLLPAAVSGVMFPAFARSFTASAATTTALFARSLKLVALILCPLCAAVVTFAPQIMSLWIGGPLVAQSSTVLQILAVGAFITGLAWIPLALLHGARRPDLPAKLHLLDFPIYALLLWFSIDKFGLTGAALTWSGRLLLENLVLFAMAANFIDASARAIVGACIALALAILVVAAGAYIDDIYLKAIFLCGVTMMTAVAAWRFLLEETGREKIIGSLPSLFAPACQKTST